MRHHKAKALLVSACILLVIGLGTVAAIGSATYPAVITLNSIQDRFGPVTFDHATHINIAGGCGVCHHQHEVEPGKGCMECHKLAPDKFKDSVSSTFIACSACHGEQTADAPGMPGLKVAYHRKCFGCHVGIGELGSSPKACAETCHAAVK